MRDLSKGTSWINRTALVRYLEYKHGAHSHILVDGYTDDSPVVMTCKIPNHGSQTWDVDTLSLADKYFQPCIQCAVYEDHLKEVFNIKDDM